MLNDRKEPRFDSVLYLPVRIHSTGELFGHLVNLSDQGLMLVGAVERDPGDSFTLDIEVPEHFLLSGPVSVETCLRWCRPDANPELYAYGMTITRSCSEFHELQRRLRTGFSFAG